MRLPELPHGLLQAFRPETAHKLALFGLAAGMGPHHVPSPPQLQSHLFGKPMPNSIGLPAGFFKGTPWPQVNLRILLALLEWGIGFIEVGSVTPLERSGNRGRRHWRLGGGSVNWYGLNGPGYLILVQTLRLLRQMSRQDVVGISLTNPADAGGNPQPASNYTMMANEFRHLADFFTLNLGCPNTNEAVNNAVEDFKRDLDAVMKGAHGIPVYVKLSPFISLAELDLLPELVEIAIDFGAAGFKTANTATWAQSVQHHILGNVANQIWSNTTPHRPNAKGVPEPVGGHSGPHMLKFVRPMVRTIRAANANIKIVGIGGIHAKVDELALREEGADAVEVLTGFANIGPRLLGQLLVA